jgi:hypothetical protein
MLASGWPDFVCFFFLVWGLGSWVFGAESCDERRREWRESGRVGIILRTIHN